MLGSIRNLKAPIVCNDCHAPINSTYHEIKCLGLKEWETSLFNLGKKKPEHSTESR